jgi:hypothetical protein
VRRGCCLPTTTRCLHWPSPCRALQHVRDREWIQTAAHGWVACACAHTVPHIQTHCGCGHSLLLALNHSAFACNHHSRCWIAARTMAWGCGGAVVVDAPM